MKKIEKEPHENFDNRVLKEFAKRMLISPIQLVQHNKRQHISDLRQLYCKLRHEKHDVNYAALGREIERDASSVREAVWSINNKLSYNDKKILEMWESVKDISEI